MKNVISANRLRMDKNETFKCRDAFGEHVLSGCEQQKNPKLRTPDRGARRVPGVCENMITTFRMDYVQSDYPNYNPSNRFRVGAQEQQQESKFS
ncbi:MAG: hypothetical protein JWM11_7490 [Planctomycetaceae bacterium]|nr:hypothetical protein [Planctomycetaceae bacterium]